MKRDYPEWAILVMALAFILPALPAHSQALTMRMCGGRTISITLAPDPSKPNNTDKESCQKACHAGNDRRKQTGLLTEASC